MKRFGILGVLAVLPSFVPTEEDARALHAAGEGVFRLTGVLTVGQAAMQVLEGIAGGKGFRNRAEAEAWWKAARGSTTQPSK